MTSSKRSQPWANMKVKCLSRRKHRALNTARNTGKWDKYNSLKRQLQRECRRAHDKWMNDMIDEEGKKFLWSYVKSKRKDVVGISSLKHNGQLISHNEKQANTLNDQFSSVFTREDDGPLPSVGTSPFPDAPDITVSPAGVRKLLQQLQPHEEMGPDQIPTKLLKVGAQELTPGITLLFQASIDQHTIPQEWKANYLPSKKEIEQTG